MAMNNRYLQLLILTVFFLLFLPPLLKAQVSGNIPDIDGEEPRFKQRLSWKGDEYALRYEVEIEKEGTEGYRSVLREFTNTPFLDVELVSGKYRFRVIPYDYLNRPSRRSEWVNIYVRPAIRPELYETEPEFTYSENGLCELAVSGRNIAPEAEVYLIRSDGERVVPVDVNVFDNGGFVRLFFTKTALIEGEYVIFVINPGGLKTNRKGITIAYLEPELKPEPELAPEPEPEPEPELVLVLEPEPEPDKTQRPVTSCISVAWVPLLPVYGEAFGQNKMILRGIAAHFSAFSLHSRQLIIWMELGACLYEYNNLIEYENVSLFTMMFELNLSVQKKLTNQDMAVCFRFGAGLSVLQMSAVINSRSIYTNMGVSFQWLALNPLYLEIGLNYVNLFTEFPSGAFRPWVGIGFQM